MMNREKFFYKDGQEDWQWYEAEFGHYVEKKKEEQEYATAVDLKALHMLHII